MTDIVTRERIIGAHGNIDAVVAFLKHHIFKSNKGDAFPVQADIKFLLNTVIYCQGNGTF